jgi:RPA family protein
MLAAEIRDTTVEIQSGGDQYKPTIYLSPTGAEVNRVLIAGTAVEKEDVGTDNSFWHREEIPFSVHISSLWLSFPV